MRHFVVGNNNNSSSIPNTTTNGSTTNLATNHPAAVATATSVPTVLNGIAISSNSFCQGSNLNSAYSLFANLTTKPNSNNNNNNNLSSSCCWQSSTLPKQQISHCKPIINNNNNLNNNHNYNLVAQTDLDELDDIIEKSFNQISKRAETQSANNMVAVSNNRMPLNVSNGTRIGVANGCGGLGDNNDCERVEEQWDMWQQFQWQPKSSPSTTLNGKNFVNNNGHNSYCSNNNNYNNSEWSKSKEWSLMSFFSYLALFSSVVFFFNVPFP